MNTNPRNSGSKPRKAPEQQGSVQRARQMLAAGERPKVQTPVKNEPEVSSKASHMTQWPLPDNSTLPGNVLDPQASLIPRGPPPPRPPRPDMPSPSIYSERSAPGIAPSPLHIKQAYPSFSQPFPRASTHHPTRETSSPASRTGASSFAPHIAVTNEDSTRRSAVSDTASIPTIPDFPLPATKKATPNTHRKSASLAPPPPPPLSNAVRLAFSRRSSVSPIPEELSDEPSNVEGSYASSKAVPSWCSTPRDSGVLGAYLDDESDDDDEETRKSTEENGEGLVRHASVGKRGKPSLRVIQKPNSNSPVPTESGRSTNSQADKTGRSLPVAVGTTGGQEGGLTVSSPKDSVSSISDRSYEFDLEKGAFMLDIGQSHPTPQQAQENDTGNPGDGAGGLPGPTPTMSVRRPGARRPPRLDMHAVRDAEARGSLTSLSDLIRRATRLATNLDHGRTASRNDVLNGNGDSRAPPWGWRNSGSLKGALASFPPPPRDGRSSWPTFFRRSTFHNIDTQAAHSDHDQEKQSSRRRRCCGMPLWLFITICVVILLAITLAVLLPVFLVVVPQENSNVLSSCEKSNPCKNGGVSVSSGSICSCVCTNGYTGSQCTASGDGSCTTTNIGENSASKSATTMGSDLPQLLEDSQKTFSIPLDSVTIMALFSQNDVSCTTQNELVSFNDVASNKNSNSNTRRSVSIQQSEELLSDTEQPSSTSDSPLDNYRRTLAARASVATMNGIVFDNSSPSSEDSLTGTQTTASAAEETAPPKSTSTSTPTTTTSTSSATTTSTSESTSVPQKAIDFSRTAVLYILEMTGTFDAAMESEESIQYYLKNTYPTSGAGRYNVNLPKSGVKSSFALDFDKYSITMSNGTSVGGS